MGPFRSFARIFPDRIQSITNGITPRRWLIQANPHLAQLITSAIGSEWMEDLNKLEKLVSYADDGEFRAAWIRTKQENKDGWRDMFCRKNRDRIIRKRSSMFISSAYTSTSQLLNALHLITLYNRLKSGSEKSFTPVRYLLREAAPAYHQAKANHQADHFGG